VGALVTAGLAGIALAGCQSASTSTPAIASAVRDPVLQDIPKPQGFRLVEERSTAFASGQVRVAKCEYVGPTAVEAVKRFYEEYMPSARFKLKQWSLDRGAFTMRFESTNELCNIRIARDGAKTSIVVEVGPLPRGTTERESPPPVRRAGPS